MPYMIVDRPNKYCVYKRGANGRPVGSALGCHVTRTGAVLQIAAIESSERKAVDPDELDEVFAKYHDIVNMSASELERWAETEYSGLASLSDAPIKRNLRLLRTPKSEWIARDITDANRTIAFVSRMRNAEQGKPVRADVPYSKRDISLMNWAYNPRKGTPVAMELTIFKQAGGLRRMFLVTSNSYEDRECETITTKALSEYVESQWEGDAWKGNNFLLFGHRGAPIGAITFAEMIGSFLVEVAAELDTPYARKRWDYIEAHPDMEWGASHGFDFDQNKKTIDGVYHHIEKFETTVLPLVRAANALTLAGVIA